MGKWNSRKLLFALLSVAVGAWQPQLIPLLKFVAPVYIGGQSLVDAGILAPLLGKSGNS